MLCRLSAEPRPDRQLRHRRALSRADEPWPASRDDCLSLADAGDSDAIPGAGIRCVEPVLLFCRSRDRAVARCPRGAPPLPRAISQSRDERDAGRARRSRRHRHVSPIGDRSRRNVSMSPGSASSARISLGPAPEPLLAQIEGQAWRLLWSSEAPLCGGSGGPAQDAVGDWLISGQSATVLTPGPSVTIPEAKNVFHLRE